MSSKSALAEEARDQIEKVGRTASFVVKTKEMPTYEAEKVTEQLCDKFEELKPYLLERWDSANS